VAHDTAQRPPPLLAKLRGLSERRRAALRRLLAGDTEAEVARHLRISELEALRELRAVYACLGVTRRRQLLVRLLPLMVELYRHAGRGY
jgi:DNA-binding CsgD family transcriptional regulator